MTKSSLSNTSRQSKKPRLKISFPWKKSLKSRSKTASWKTKYENAKKGSEGFRNGNNQERERERERHLNH